MENLSLLLIAPPRAPQSVFFNRLLAEYRTIFMFTDADLNQAIFGCSDEPASFNVE
ncbi:hypothetical protein [uncultured Desulfuromonas sp.]|uniref:hypothetical protein n=1 Tax=uncultured Desulfuromonas sp. TaxID=181013 RepID=UPI002AAB7FD9|nr:hypothetical protein [uncultured Desulfuromonas sp.]